LPVRAPASPGWVGYASAGSHPCQYDILCRKGDGMTLPPLRLDGTLPPGAYVADLSEVFAAFPARTAKRRDLNQALAFCVAAIKRSGLADEIVLDGSYITRKPNPSDVDMAVLTPGIYQKAGKQMYAAEGIDLQLLDIQFAHDQADFQQWQAFFSLTRTRQPKGIILLIF